MKRGSRHERPTAHTNGRCGKCSCARKAGLDHKHCGSLHAADPKMAMQMARDVYTRRQEGTQRVGGALATRSSPATPATRTCYFDPADDKVYRHPTFYKLPESVDHM